MSYPSTIKAVGIQQTGGVKVIENVRLPFPEVKPNELVIKVGYPAKYRTRENIRFSWVEWVGVNFVDTIIRSGLYTPAYLPLPVANETSGIIEELPKDETVLYSDAFKSRGFKKGSRVALDTYSVLQEYDTVPWDGNMYALPDDVSTRLGATALLQGITALAQETESYEVKRGDNALVYTVAGGVGLILAQNAKLRGATVIGTTSTPQKAEYAKAYGVDRVILYPSESTVDRVLELTGRQGVEVIYDGVGKDTFEDDLKMIRRKGTLVSFGYASGLVPPVPLTKLVQKNIKLVRPTISNYLATLEERNFYGNELFKLLASVEVDDVRR
ncbi:NAD(P)-binding protein [Artomyces pyxidatus]|uniref:NAD(P)-binding protein n=1 Tax=Artomyces pyxidatus TaxID=48021 RepID=A0ACB8SUG0_9AGAM|nr:NAD(P)-binding protein [Artomyces pyxidatus]